MNLEHANAELFAALAKAQGEVQNATKDTDNAFFKTKYADLAAVLNTIRPVFAKQGLSIVQSTAFDGSMVSVTTALCHSSGSFITSVASCIPAKADAQGIGSATTYLRRYGVAAITGIAQEDDDGQSARHERPPNDPRPAAVATVDPARVAKYVDKVKALKAEDIEGDHDGSERCRRIFAADVKMSEDPDLACAVMDALVAQKIYTKAEWRAAVAAGRKTAGTAQAA